MALCSLTLVSKMASRTNEMGSTNKTPFKITVLFETREDGGLRAYSEDLPGFVLSHADSDAVMADIEPSLECILSAMLGYPVRATLLPSAAEVFQHRVDPLTKDYLASIAA